MALHLPDYEPTTTSLWFENDGVHVAGHYGASSGDLAKHWVRITAQFILDKARLPPANKTYVSNRVAFAGGETYGWCGIPGVIDAGDYWAKGWLNTKHTLLVLPEGLFDSSWSGPDPLLASQSHQLVFLENSAFDYQPLPGVMAMPLVTFYLPQNTHMVISELDWEFHVQVEGEGSLNIGHTNDTPSCLIQHPQWTIRPW